MRLFRCQACGQTVYFENTQCERCRSPLGYLPEIGLMSALEPETAPELLALLDQAGLQPVPAPTAPAGDVWIAWIRPGRRYRYCSNAEADACNWLIPAESDQTRCTACRYNQQLPDLDDDENLARWRKLEVAKHRLLYSLVKLQLPIPSRAERRGGLGFAFPADPADPKAPRVLTGHAGGLITIALREADDVEREKMRRDMGEPYRTLLGHFRHETGHFFWDRLVRDAGRLEACRAAFGDDRRDYGRALKRYYAEGAPEDWQDRFISAYATMHPWEDFAETWAHYLHMIDTLETASAHGVVIQPRGAGAPRTDQTGTDPTGTDPTELDPYRVREFAPIIGNWLPLATAANSLNRSMGLPDLYPFVLSDPVIDKLRFVHELIWEHRTALATV
ncbi:MAG: putative zinc-binding peptidase [Acetobacteraceae bacterium]